jgi:hypothetical protein
MPATERSSQRQVRRFTVLARIIFASAIGVACTDASAPPPALTPVGPHGDITMSNCGARYTLITDETDSLLAQYGAGDTHDTIAVCETWVGSDYTTQTSTIGSSSRTHVVQDTVQGETYSGGMLTAQAADGSQIEAPSTVGGSTLFDYMNADAGQVQASYDNPYYGVYAPGGGYQCLDPSGCAQAAVDRSIPSATGFTRSADLLGMSTRLGASTNVPQASRDAIAMATTPDTTKYRRHGLHRAGTRALVDNMEEITRSPEGYRRFHTVRGTDDVILSIDPKTELLVAEETHSKSGHVFHTKHFWAWTPTGYMRSHSDIDDEEVIRGTRYVNHASISIQDLAINGVSVAPQSGERK